MTVAALSVSGLRVCFVAGTLGSGGAERQLFYMTRELKRAGADVRVLSLRKGELWQPRIEAVGVPVVWVGESESRALRMARIAREVRAFRPEILQAGHFFTNLYVASAARLVGAKDFGAIRNDVYSELRALGPLLGQASLRAPTKLIVNSRAAVENATKVGIARDRLEYLPNVVDTDVFHPIERPPNPRPRILSVGRLERSKRHDLLIEALAGLRNERGLDFEAEIVGTGSLRGALDAQCRARGLDDRVRFLGHRDDMPAVYQAADVFVLTSDHEGTPNAVMEAMASGVAVVATAVGGVAELIHDASLGFVVAPRDRAAIASSLAVLITEPERARRARTAAAQAMRSRGTASAATRLGLLYGAALESRTSRSAAHAE
ncbi:MAG: glycosyltransferase [Deltaproteobacteria bacterium]|nr:glycosyltransferase [Deltaproteobacteria bacterium]